MIKHLSSLYWKNRLHDAGLNQEDHEHASLSKESLEHGAQLAGDCKIGESVTLHGVISSVTLRPSEAVKLYQVTLSDGTRPVDLLFLGRHYIQGIDAGRRLSASGRLQLRNGVLSIYNPRYELFLA